MQRLASRLISLMPRLTVIRSSAKALENAQHNLPYGSRTILDLVNRLTPKGPKSAIVIAAGPSLHRKNPVRTILKNRYQGEVIAVDGALAYCLRNGLVPDYVVTLDPHPTRVCRWFGDPELESRPDDDYFRRQEMDPYLGIDEYARNRELIDLVNRHGPKIRAIISTSVAPAVTRRCLEAGMQLYWWNPIFDDVEDPESMTQRVYRLNKVPCMVSGGNVGSAAWIFAHQVLRKKEVALVGMDLSYTPDTPIEKTQYSKEIRDLFGERATDAFIRVHNPYLKETWYSDPAYYWYRQTFLQMAREADCVTFNCTEGGILFGKPIRFVPLLEFFNKRNRKRKRS